MIMGRHRGGAWARGFLAAGVASALGLGAMGARAQPGSGSRAQPGSGSRDQAPPSEVEGAVLAVEKADLIVDLGANRGGVDGAVVELWRPLKLKHPVTGKVITDRFRIGTLQLAQVRPTLALARIVGELAREPRAADIVILKLAPGPAPSQPRPGLSPEVEAAPAAEQDREARQVAEMFDSLQGSDPATRVRSYEDYVRAQPNGRFARVLFEEAASLRKLLAPKERNPRDAAAEPRPVARSFQGPSDALEGTPLRIAVELSDGSTGALLHVRRPGQRSYVSVPMSPGGEGYFAATVPREMVATPRFEYFIEGTTPSGAAASVVASADSPESVNVLDVPRGIPARNRDLSVVLMTEYADYNRLRGNDRVWQTEGHFGVRYSDTGVRALRSGFGVYRGVGGSVEELDREENPLPGRRIGLTYGYLETEVGFTDFVSVIGRGVIGLLDDGVSGGGQLFVRLGNDRRTNLMVGGEILGGVGLRTITQLELNMFERVPIVLRAETTNQPAGGTPVEEQGDPETTAQGESQRGTRLIVQVGYRILPELVVAVRASSQGRTINHAGPGAGAALGFTW